MKGHLKESHAWTSGERGGRPSKFAQAASAALVTSFYKVKISIDTNHEFAQEATSHSTVLTSISL